MDQTSNVLTIVGALFTAIAVIGAAYAVWRAANVKASLDLLITVNDELRKSNDDLREELAVEREKRATLEGKLDALTSDLADRIVRAVLAAIKHDPNDNHRNPNSKTRATDRSPQ